MIPRAQRAYELYSVKYQQMAAAYPQVLVSQRTLFRLQMSYLRSLEAEWVSAVRLQNYTLGGGLDRAASSGDDRGNGAYRSAAPLQGWRAMNGGAK